MKRLLTILLLLCTSALCFSLGGKENTIQTRKGEAGIPLKIHIETGTEWTGNSYNNPPQIAVWIADKDGQYLDTLYVTEKFAKQSWAGIPGQKADETYRSNSIPLWLDEYTRSGNAAPTKEKPLPDTITAATPRESFSLTTIIPEKYRGKNLKLRMEINLGSDYNGMYPERRTKYSGQPAILYEADLTSESRQNSETLPLKALGITSMGSLTKDLSTVNSALNIVKGATVMPNP